MANEPDLVQRLSVDFNVSMGMPVQAEFGTVYVVGGDGQILYGSTATWNSQPLLVSLAGYIYVYSDYRQNQQGQNVPAMKVGDGTSYLIDMPFTDDLFFNHLDNTVVHITQAEREFWNAKVRCYMSGENNLVFTTD